MYRLSTCANMLRRAIPRAVLLLGAALTACTDRTGPIAPAEVSPTPSALVVSTPGAYAAVSTGDIHSCALTTGGAIVCFGYSDYGLTTVPAAARNGVRSVISGEFVNCALTLGSAVVCWGFNNYGQTTVPAAALEGVTAVSTGGYHTCALKTSGSLVCWGYNAQGQTTVPTAALTGVTAVSAGIYHSCALTTDRAVVCWGSNDYGQATVPSAARNGVAAVSAGGNTSCALKTTGEVVCWGDNGHGQTTVPAAALSGVTAVSAGGVHTCALTTDGAVVCWGWNVVGQTTVPPDALNGVAAVSAGNSHTCALKTTGAIACWGDNGHGQTNVPPAPSTNTRVQPAATFVAPTTVAAGQSVDLTMTNAQVPGFPSATTFTYAFDCGTGTYAEASSSNTAGCPTTTVGTIAVRGMVIDQDGDAAEYSASVSVTSPSQTIAFTSTPPITVYVGATYTLSATGGASGSPVLFSSLTPATCTVTNATATFASAGLCTVAADQAGDAGYSAAPQVTQSTSVVRLAQTIVVTSPVPASAPVGTTLLLSATGGGSGSPVVITSLTTATCAVLGSQLTLSSAGTCQVEFSQAGSASYEPAAPVIRSISITAVTLRAQAITVTSALPTVAKTGTTLQLTATGGASGNPVVFASLTPSTCTVASSTLSLTAAGACAITFSQAGTATYAAAPTVTRGITVTKSAQVIAFTPLPATAAVGAVLPLSATGGASGNPVVFASQTPSSCAVSGATLTLNARGACTVVATQAGTAAYDAATPVTRNVAVVTALLQLRVAVAVAAISAPLKADLLIKLVGAELAFNTNNRTTGCNLLNAFVNQLQAQRGVGLTPVLADAWLALAAQAKRENRC